MRGGESWHSAESPHALDSGQIYCLAHMRLLFCLSNLSQAQKKKIYQTKKQQICQKKEWNVTQSLEIQLTFPNNWIAWISSLNITLIHLVIGPWTVFPIRLQFFSANQEQQSLIHSSGGFSLRTQNIVSLPLCSPFVKFLPVPCGWTTMCKWHKDGRLISS